MGDANIDDTPLPGFFLRFTTQDFSGSTALEAWRDFFGSALMRVDMQPRPSGSLYGAAQIIYLPNVTIGFVSSSSSRFVRDALLAADGNADFLLIITTSGSLDVTGGAGEDALAAGEACLIACGERGAIEVTGPSAFVAIRVSSDIFRPLVAAHGETLPARVASSNGVLQLLLAYVAALTDGMSLADGVLRQRISTHVQDMVALTIQPIDGGQPVARGHGVQGARLRAVKRDVMAALSEQGLSAKTLAEQRGISERYLRRLFEADGQTFTEFVATKRLERVHAILSDDGAQRQSIGVIALECGFSDVSTFNRMFRSRFGVTPSEVRKAAFDANLNKSSRM